MRVELIFLGIVLIAAIPSCKRDAIRPDHFISTERSPLLDSLLTNTTPAILDLDEFMLPDGQNMKEFLLSINPALDSILPRTDNHPFYDLVGNDLKNLLVTYMTMKAANAYASSPGQYPGNGNNEPEQDRLGYALGSSQVDLRTPGIGSLPSCPRIFGLDESGFLRHILEGAFLTLPQNFQPHVLKGYNDALGLSGLSYELEFEEFENFNTSFIRPGDLFVMYTENQQGNSFFHYGLVMGGATDPELLMLADCFGDVSNTDCKTDVGANVGPRLVNFAFLMGDVNNVTEIEYKIIRLKKKFYQPFVSELDPDIGVETGRYGDQIWMTEDLLLNGSPYFRYYDLDILPHSTQGVCPDGWHVPSLSEWETLFNTLGAEAYPWPQNLGQIVWYYQGIGYFMKSTTGWDPSGNNLYGFNIEPKGYMDVDRVTIKGAGQTMGYWTSSNLNMEGAPSIVFDGNHHDVLADPLDLKSLGYGCRCVKDTPGNNPDQCKHIPIVFHFLKCSTDPTHPINQVDISIIYDHIAYLNDVFRFSTYCVEFYLACENGQPVFEVHDICDGSFSSLNPALYVNPDKSLQYGSLHIIDSIVPQIQSDSYLWHPDQYINIYVALTRNGAIASLPGSQAKDDAIIMPLEWMGGEAVAVEGGDGMRTYTLAHEIGHYLSLLHPWGNEALHPNGLLQSQCGSMNSGILDVTTFYGNVWDEYVTRCSSNSQMRNENIMSYGPYGVATKFTLGQKNDMKAYLESPASMGGRKELVRTSNACD